MNKKSIIVLTVLSIFGYSHCISAANITITSSPSNVKDAYVDSNAPATNFETSALKIINYPSNYEVRSLIQFTLPGILNGQTIDLATLYLYKSNDGGGITGDLVTAKRVTSPWDESSVTWATQPTFDSVYENTQPIDDGYLGQIVFDITDLVASWVDGSSANYGTILVHEPVASAEKNFYSSESGIGTPFLYIEYSANPVPEPFTIFLLLSSVFGLFLRGIKKQ
ncbi:MAG: DNRLRE domain-containing protein [bacterium]|nr:DNRLRE domain-containing protein [bacterium]